MAKVKNLKNSKVEFKIKLEEKALEKAKRSVIARLKNEVNIKGFRAGHAPDSKVIEHIGEDRLNYDAINKLIDNAYKDYVTENELAVINQPEVDVPEDMKFPMEITCVVEVYPKVELGDYKKIKVKQEKVKVTDKDVEEALETACAQLQLGTEVKKKAADKHLVEVDFVAKDEKGEEIPNTKGENQKFRIGMGQYLPDLEKAFTGMKAGETKEKVKVKFPKDYHAKDMADKTILFDIKMHKVFEISVKDLTEDDVEKLSGEKQSVKKLMEIVKENITKNKDQQARTKATDEYTAKLVKLVKVELPQSWLEREVQNRMQQFMSNPQLQQNPEMLEMMMKDPEAMKKDMKIEGEKDLKTFLGLSEVVKVENIELDKDEMEQAHHMAHQALGQEGHHHGEEHDSAMQKAILDMQIDKFLKTAIMD